MSRAHPPDAGFSLAEVLAASAIVAIGLLAMAAALHYAASAIETGRGDTSAALLAEQKLEQLKTLALTDWASSALISRVTTEYCHPSGTGCVGAPEPGLYRRATTITDNPGGACSTSCKLVRVAVSYRSVAAAGGLDGERHLELVTMFVSRT